MDAYPSVDPEVAQRKGNRIWGDHYETEPIQPKYTILAPGIAANPSPIVEWINEFAATEFVDLEHAKPRDIVARVNDLHGTAYGEVPRRLPVAFNAASAVARRALKKAPTPSHVMNAAAVRAASVLDVSKVEASVEVLLPQIQDVALQLHSILDVLVTVGQNVTAMWCTPGVFA